MAAQEIAEVADIFKLVLSNTRPRDKSLAKYDLEDSVKATAKARIASLMAPHQLYPEIDVRVAVQHFGLELERLNES